MASSPSPDEHHWRGEHDARPHQHPGQHGRSDGDRHADREAHAQNVQVLSRAISLDSGRGRAATLSDDGRPLTLLETLSARDAGIDPESRLVVREQLTGLLRALPTLTASEHTALTGTLGGRSCQQMAPTPFATWKAAEHAAYRARRKLAASLPRAA
jgi:hypothetical protein